MSDTTDELIRLPAVCDYCREPFEAAGVAHPFREGELLTRQRACPKCFAEWEANQAAQSEQDRQLAKQRAHEDTWAKLCPMLYRSEAEGGLTDVARLATEQPKLAEILKSEWGFRGVILVGSSGGGKTRCLWRLLRKFHDEHRSIAAFSAGSFERACRDAGGSYTLNAFADRLANADCFFVDDVGKAPWSPATVGLFFDLIEQRIGNGRPIYLTTNLNGESLMQVLKVGPDIGKPMLRRLREFTITFVMQTTTTPTP